MLAQCVFTFIVLFCPHRSSLDGNGRRDHVCGSHQDGRRRKIDFNGTAWYVKNVKDGIGGKEMLSLASSRLLGIWGEQSGSERLRKKIGWELR